ncbi:MAG: PASTA domain-containing protein, partial [Planctomycetota bacterium]
MKVEKISTFFWAALLALVLSVTAWAEPVIVPDVVGLSEPDANFMLTTVGLVVGVVRYDYSDSVAAGL